MAAAPRRSRWRRLWLCVLGGLLAWGIAIACGMNPSVPSDFVLNLVPVRATEPTLCAPDEGRCLVVVQHGMWRSAWAMWRLERALVAHGYEVLNVSYPSTSAWITDHAAALDAELDRRLTDGGTPASVYFVGHSMGGLVIRAYLARDDAVQPAGCVFVATPHRGAQLAALRRGHALFGLLMGDKAARQLEPGEAFYAGLRPLAGVRVGTIVGGKGDGEGYSATLPGDDDGTVTVAEARCADETATVLLHQGHTRIGFSDAMIDHVLHFLRRGGFGEGSGR